MEETKCQLCSYNPEGNNCEHPKNAYCKLYLAQAEQDAKNAGMHPSAYNKNCRSLVTHFDTCNSTLSNDEIFNVIKES